jgi:hypothetical protein
VGNVGPKELKPCLLVTESIYWNLAANTVSCQTAPPVDQGGAPVDGVRGRPVREMDEWERVLTGRHLCPPHAIEKLR